MFLPTTQSAESTSANIDKIFSLPRDSAQNIRVGSAKD